MLYTFVWSSRGPRLCCILLCGLLEVHVYVVYFCVVFSRSTFMLYTFVWSSRGPRLCCILLCGLLEVHVYVVYFSSRVEMNLCRFFSCLLIFFLFNYRL
jgi:hypothetical protein